jgi:hypothetical protein
MRRGRSVKPGKLALVLRPKLIGNATGATKLRAGPVWPPVLGRPRKPVARAEAPSAFWQETEAKAKERRRLYLQKRYPDRGL